MRKLIILIILLYAFGLHAQQSEYEEIKATVQKFITGTVYNYPDTILSAFHPGTKMFLHSPANPTWEVAIEKYASWYGRKAPGTINNRPSKIISIEQVLNVAYARVEVLFPSNGYRYNDLLLLKKFPNGWKIVAKCTSAEPIPKRPDELISTPRKEVVMEGLSRPWSMAFLSENEALIAEKDGNLIRTNLLSGERQIIDGLPKDVARAVLIDTTKFEKGIFPSGAHGKELSFNAGWFQVLLDPDFENNHYIYLSYAAENKKRASAAKVIRGILKDNTLTQVETLFEAAPFTHGLFHYGGGMIFGPDKKLYITLGDRNFQEYMNPEVPLAQDLTDKWGKIIRINSDGSIPADNPDFGPKAVKGLYAVGIRASQGLTINSETNQIWFSEHGTMQGDELNILKAGANYGWPFVTSGKYRSSDFNPTVPEGIKFTAPVFAWDKTIAPTGLAYYTGSEFPLWKGNILVPGLSKGSLWRIVVADEQVISTEEFFINDRVRIRKVAISPGGQIYLLTDEENGKLIRLVNENAY